MARVVLGDAGRMFGWRMVPQMGLLLVALSKLSLEISNGIPRFTRRHLEG